MLDLVIAQCPRCNLSRYSYSKEDAVQKLEAHKCLQDWTEGELHMRLLELCYPDICYKEVAHA